MALGQGEYGITYIAWDMQDERRLAIKEFFPAGLATRTIEDPELHSSDSEDGGLFEYGIEQFLEEARALARYKGEPGIVHVYDYFRSNGTAYMVMAFIEGISFQEYLGQKADRLSVAETCPIIVKIAESLDKPGLEGLLHRRLSPEDVYLTADDGVVVTDFGFARHAIMERQTSQSVQKRRKYGLEEKVRRMSIQGPWIDVYAVGELFYRAITGRVPQAYEDRQQRDTLVPPSYLGVNIAESVEQIIMKALAVRTDERYPDLGAFREALLGIEPEPSVVLPPSVPTPPAEQRLDDLIDSASYYIPLAVRDGEGLETSLDESPDENGGHGLESGTGSLARPGGNKKRLIGAVAVLLLLIVPVLAYVTGYWQRSGMLNGWMVSPGDEDSGLSNGQLTVDDDPMEIFVAGEWIYYVNNSDGTRLYRVKTDGTGRQRLNQDWSVNIIVAGDWVYYVNNSEQMKLYRVKTDGSERQKLNDEYTLQILVAGDWVYYTSETDNLAMYRVTTDGGSRQKLHEGCSYCLNVVGDWIYFNWINFQNVDETGLYRMKADGSDSQKIGAGLASYGIVEGDWVYYNNKSDGFKLYRMKTDGSQAQKLGGDEAQNIAVAGDWIYYVNKSDGRKIYRIMLDGSGRQKLGDDQSMNMQVAGDWVYYRKDSESGSLYRIRTEGGEPQLIVK